MQDSFTIAEIVSKFVEESPTKFDTPGQRGHPQTYLENPLRRLLLKSTPTEDSRKNTGGHPAKAYSKEDIVTALDGLRAELQKSQKSWIREKASEIAPLIDRVVLKLQRD